jgi:hypothetical protein
MLTCDAVLLNLLTDDSTGCSIQNATLTITHEPLHIQNDETDVNIEFLQPYPVVAADALLEIGTATISAVLSLDERLSQNKHFVHPEVLLILLPVGVLLSYLLNASRRATIDFDAK